MTIFVWGASIFFKAYRAPKQAMEIYVVGKQWMWKFQHATGQREINELHVPVGARVKLTMTTEDVIHSFYVPAFRIKQDVVPGRYLQTWFEATKPGKYYLFCAEYCGTNHSGMIGSVVVMEPPAYQAWLAGGGEGSLAERGAALFNQLACSTCHLDSGQGRGPSLKDIFGKPVELADGSKVTVDEVYLRESILTSQAKIVKGFQPLMPTFQGLVSEEGLVALIEHVRSLSPNASSTTSAAPAAPAAPGAAGAAPAPAAGGKGAPPPPVKGRP
jgi:cytochrome c oxidase subunit II